MKPISNVIGNIFVHVRRMKRAIEWYGMLMSMPTYGYVLERPHYMFDMENGTNMLLDDNRFNRQASYPYMMIKADNITAAYDYIQSNRIDIVSEIETPFPELSHFTIKDPENRLVMITCSNFMKDDIPKRDNPDHPLRNNIDGILVPVGNPERTLHWYSTVLGTSVDIADGCYGSFRMKNGLELKLVQYSEEQKNPIVVLTVQDVEGAIDLLAHKAIAYRYSGAYVHFQDPEGNSLAIRK